MNRPPLPVFLYGHHVADLLDAGFGDTAVRYTTGAVEVPAARRLSLSLPVQPGVHIAGGPGGVWVRSLLPEGRALAWAVTEFGVDEQDRYGLIAAIGADVAGAAQVLLPGHTPQESGSYERLDRETVISMVQRAHDVGLGLDRQRGVRLSLAGMQDKVLLHRHDGEWFLPLHGAASSRILKPEPPPSLRHDGRAGFAGLATNELFCLKLAARCGMRVATAAVEPFGDTPTLVVERYDRRADADGAVVRLHQEDLLSALGRDPALKYEQPGVERRSPIGGFADVAAFVSRPGPTLRDLAALLAAHLGRANLGPFLAAVTFNVAIGNADAHARNYSVILAPDGNVALAPLYDLVCTRYWDHLDHVGAQRVAGIEDIDKVRDGDLVAEAALWGFPRRVASNRIGGILGAMSENLEAAASDCVASGGDETVAHQVRTMVAARVDQMRGGPR